MHNSYSSLRSSTLLSLPSSQGLSDGDLNISGCSIVSTVEKHEQLATYLASTPSKVMFPWAAGVDALETSSLLPGSFNPIHKGHVEMCGNEGGWYELSIGNVDKGFIAASEVKEVSRDRSGEDT